MFCKNCGSNLPDDAKFCASCGKVVSEEGFASVQSVSGYALKQSSPMISNCLSSLKSFWTNPVATVGASAKSYTHEWALFMIAEVLFYALGTAVVGVEMISQLLKSALGTLAGALDVGRVYPFFAIFGIGILIGAVAYFGTSFGIWLFISKIFKKNASFINALNMTAVACLPLMAIHIFNMLFGLIFSPLTVVFFVAAFTMSVVCLYTGIQKFDKLDKSPFYGFAIVLSIVILVSCLLGMLYGSAIVDSIKSFATSAISGAVGSLLGDTSGIMSMF